MRVSRTIRTIPGRVGHAGGLEARAAQAAGIAHAAGARFGIGLVTGGGLASVLRRHYSRRLMLVLVTLLFVANTVNIGADIAAVAAGINLLTGLPEKGVIIPVGVGIAVTEIIVPYRIFASYLKLLTLVLLAAGLIGLLCYAWRKRK